MENQTKEQMKEAVREVIKEFIEQLYQEVGHHVIKGLITIVIIAGLLIAYKFGLINKVL